MKDYDDNEACAEIVSQRDALAAQLTQLRECIAEHDGSQGSLQVVWNQVIDEKLLEDAEQALGQMIKAKQAEALVSLADDMKDGMFPKDQCEGHARRRAHELLESNAVSKGKPATYRIRAFGDDRGCHSVQELQDTLGREYRGQSVSVIQSTAPHGMLRTHFIDVLDTGEAVASYGDQSPIDFETIAAESA